MNLEKELEVKYLRAIRLKSLKELEKEYSKEIIELYKTKLNNKKEEEDFKSVIDMYKNKLEEINFLKIKKEEILKTINTNQTLTQKQNRIMEEYFKELEWKKIEFDKFMSEKGKEALNFVKQSTELKKHLKEELFKFEKKREVKATEKHNASKIVTAFREKEILKEKENSQPDLHENVLYKINQTFHNLGNKIDFTTTRFHNIMVIKHEDQMKEIDEALSATQKANYERENTRERKKSKEISKIKFERETKLNGKEIIRKQKARENLKRLDEELSKINQAKKRSKSKNHVITRDNMIKQSKFMEKRSENMLNNLLTQKMTNRHQILNRIEHFPEVNKMEEHELELADENEISKFYREEENVDNREESLTDYDVLEIKIKKEYEEPISREFKPKEEISRLNPVDLESFRKIHVERNHEGFNTNVPRNSSLQENVYTNFNNFVGHKNSNTNFNSSVDNFVNGNLKNKNEDIYQTKNYPDKMIINRHLRTDLNIDDIVKLNKKYSVQEDRNKNLLEDDLKKEKASSIINEFFKDLNDAKIIDDVEDKSLHKKEISKFVYEEPKPKKNEFNIQMNNLNKKYAKEFSFNNSDLRNQNKVKHLPEEKKENVLEDCEENVNNFQRDEAKWKYTKNDLLERKKKMLKDKSLFKKKN